MTEIYLIVDCRGQSLRALPVGQSVARVSLLGNEWASITGSVIDALVLGVGFSIDASAGVYPDGIGEGGFCIFVKVGSGSPSRALWRLRFRCVGGRVVDYMPGDYSLLKGLGYA